MTQPKIHTGKFAMAALLLLLALFPGALRDGKAANAAPESGRSTRTAARAGNTALRSLPLLFEPAGPAGASDASSADRATPQFVARGDGYELRLCGLAAEFDLGGSSLGNSAAKPHNRNS